VGDEERRRAVRQALVAAASDLNVGAGEDPATDVCPMVSAESRERVAWAIERGQGEGAELLLDGRGDAGPAGTMLGPTIAVADPESELVRPRVPERVALRQRRRDLHLLGRGGPRLPLRG
jgi:acyl-CoA reductase-like NAD-dependent aldehyde dehydrogenase